MAPSQLRNQFGKICTTCSLLWYGGLIGGCLAQVNFQLLCVSHPRSYRRRQVGARVGFVPVEPPLLFYPTFEWAQERCDHVEAVFLDQIMAIALLLLLLGLVSALEGG